jgi:hypothetical protein
MMVKRKLGDLTKRHPATSTSTQLPAFVYQPEFCFSADEPPVLLNSI